MEIKHYNPNIEEGGCVVRSFSKAFNKTPDKVIKEMKKIGSILNDIDTFEKYMFDNGLKIDDKYNDKLLDDCTFKGINIVFMYKGDWYHMICVIDNYIYDKCTKDELEGFKIIKVYN